MNAAGWVLCGVSAAGLALVAVLWRARRAYVVVTVEGSSMAPALADGDRVLVRRRRAGQVRRGDVVVLEPPPDPSGPYQAGPPAADGSRWNIKRATALPGDPLPPGVPAPGGVDRVPAGTVVVLGDNPLDSIDSRHRGLFPADRILGVALRRLNGPPR
ncbi:S26 family signal peptidase [Nonomuraea sp. GTA35]|uniref:S26 family signal peptidase n=1 Tax=Nonomuraea sp. GTA35 TaxID=1676746 RepID=UPI0035C16A02